MCLHIIDLYYSWILKLKKIKWLPAGLIRPWNTCKTTVCVIMPYNMDFMEFIAPGSSYWELDSADYPFQTHITQQIY